VQFQLFRLRVLFSRQLNLFERFGPSRDQLIEGAIGLRPSRTGPHGHTWHIGNLERVDDHALHFALGRTKKTQVELLDEVTGDFRVAPFESAPYTHVFVDTKFQVCAIARKSLLGETPAIGKRLEWLLNGAFQIGDLDPTLSVSESQKLIPFRFDSFWKSFRESNTGYLAASDSINFAVDPLKDPEPFIAYLDKAIAIKRFTIGFRRPNPFDARRDFQKPSQLYLQELNGRHGTTTFSGRALDPTPLKELAHAAAASGDNAGALLVVEGKDRPIYRQLRRNGVTLDEEEAEILANMTGWMGQIRMAYERVFGQTDER
jgi:hypothetical protein